MRAAVVRRRDLHVLHITTAVRALVLDPEIGELNTFVHDRKVVLMRPLFDLFASSRRPTVAVRALAVSLLQEPLVLPLEFVVEDNALNARAPVLQALGAP